MDVTLKELTFEDLAFNIITDLATRVTCAPKLARLLATLAAPPGVEKRLFLKDYRHRRFRGNPRYASP